MTPHYENAISKYFQSLKITPLPLISWDIFSTYQLDEALFNSIQKEWSKRENFHEIAHQNKKVIIITDEHLKIVFTSNNVKQMNGYTPHEILGRSPKMFQGKLTQTIPNQRIKKAISELKPFKEIVLNYRKDGTTYKCEIEALPKFSSEGTFLHYVAIERIAS